MFLVVHNLNYYKSLKFKMIVLVLFKQYFNQKAYVELSSFKSMLNDIKCL